jgi:hypothetical protein
MGIRAHSAPKRNKGKGIDPGFGPRHYVERMEAHAIVPGRGAESADRMERAAWPGRSYRSAYSSIVQLPDVVHNGDRAAAHAIHDRILKAIEIGGWTTNEWNRLHKLEETWRMRAAGKDTAFNLRGWKRQGTGHHTPGIEKFISTIRGITTNVGISN